MYKNFLFDLDGTLLPMDMGRFVAKYIESICRRVSPETGIDPKRFAKGIWTGAGAMAKNDGNCLNIDVFWQAMNEVCDRDMRVFTDDFDDYYRNEFIAAKEATPRPPATPKPGVNISTMNIRTPKRKHRIHDTAKGPRAESIIDLLCFLFLHPYYALFQSKLQVLPSLHIYMVRDIL